MNGRTRIGCAFLLLALSTTAAAGPRGAPSAPVKVAIPTAGLSLSPASLVAFDFATQGVGVHPAIVMMHGCGGAYARTGALGARHRMWGEYLASLGYEALMLDSFSSRGIKEICTTRYGERVLKESARVADAYAALAWLRKQPGVDAAHIGLLGWSHGAGVTLDAIRHKPPSMAGFAAAVAFYPGCTARNRNAATFHPYAPLLVLIGESDDWTPAAPCKSLAAAVAAHGDPMSIVTYPDTYHDFDNPAIKSKRVRKEVPNGANPGHGVTVAPNPRARDDARQRVAAFFAEHLR
jgi:dienelactone hydrolase